MRILIAGATGAIGRKLVPALVEAGHEVTGTSRSAERGEELAKLGATPAVMDALDLGATAATVAGAKPDVIVHQLTALPNAPNPRKSDIYKATDRLRREGTANLVAAASEAGVKRIVAQSIAFAYAPEGGAIKDEEAPLAIGAPEPFGATVEAVAELERQVTQTDGIDGVVLRYGWFYGPGTYSDWLPMYAKALGTKPPRRIPRFVARLAAGPVVAHMATEMRGASNAKAKRELSWSPRYPSVRDGFAGLSS